MANSLLLVALVLAAFASVVCVSAQTPLASCTPGRITYFDNYNNAACGFGTLSQTIGSEYGTALNTAFYNNALHCGECYELYGPSGSTIVTVVDLCPAETNEVCRGDIDHFDVTQPSFPALAPTAVGVAPVYYRQVACAVTGNVKVRIRGANDSWMSATLYNHVVGIRAVSYRESGQTAWVDATRSADNQWPYNAITMPLAAPVAIRVTSQYGEVIEGSVSGLTVDGLYDIGVQFSAPAAAGSEDCCESPDVFSTIYSGGSSLGGAWTDQSYGTHTTTLNVACDTAGLPSATTCLQSQLGAYAGLQPYNSYAKGTGEFTALDFWVRSATAGAQLTVRIGAGTAATIDLVAADTWQHVTLALAADLGVSADFQAVNLQNGAASATYQFAFVQFSAVTGAEVGCSTVTIPGISGGTTDKKDNAAATLAAGVAVVVGGAVLAAL